jgi:hypothetical protein
VKSARLQRHFANLSNPLNSERYTARRAEESAAKDFFLLFFG